MRVLIVDDDPLIVRLLTANLKAWGYETTIATDGTKALAAIVADPAIRLVISDWMMPGMNGVELCRRIRELQDRPYTYVMLLTAKDQAEDLIVAFQAGADEFVTKPFRGRELQARMVTASRLIDAMSKRGEGSSSMPAPDAGLVLGDRYRLKRLLGAGGMGTVWEADHLTLGSTVAVKFLRPEYASDPQARARFETEARSTARVASPHIVAVLDFGSCEGVPYLVMEHLHGTSVADVVGQHGPMAPLDVARMISEVAQALDRAHAVGVLHRDVKPENILLVEDAVTGEITTKLIDFGVAKVIDPTATPAAGLRLTCEGVVVGTPHFMSPEYLAGGAPPDAMLDLWGLAASAYVALVGHLPFDGDTVWAVIASVCNNPLPVPSKHRADLPEGIDAWFKSACSRNPAERFRSGEELAARLGALCAASARSESGSSSSPRWGSHHGPAQASKSL